jgi:LysM repeat protein
MSIKICNVSIDENGHATNGKIGDQTSKEAYIRDWYQYRNKWNVYLECTDKELADRAATYIEQICSDNNYGYDQNERWTGYHSIRKNGNRVKGGKGEFDCSSSTVGSYLLAGLKIKSDDLTTNPEKFTIYTGNIKELLLSTGKFKAYKDSDHLTSDKYAKRGGIYLSEGHHVVMVLENGSAYTIKNEPTYKTYIVVKGDNLSKISLEFLGKASRYTEIMKLNNLKTDVIDIGQTLKVPNK